MLFYAIDSSANEPFHRVTTALVSLKIGLLVGSFIVALKKKWPFQGMNRPDRRRLKFGIRETDKGFIGKPVCIAQEKNVC